MSYYNDEGHHPQLNQNNEYQYDLKIHFETSSSKQISARGTNAVNTPPKSMPSDLTADFKLQMIAQAKHKYNQLQRVIQKKKPSNFPVKQRNLQTQSFANIAFSTMRTLESHETEMQHEAEHTKGRLLSQNSNMKLIKLQKIVDDTDSDLEVPDEIGLIPSKQGLSSQKCQYSSSRKEKIQLNNEYFMKKKYESGANSVRSSMHQQYQTGRISNISSQIERPDSMNSIRLRSNRNTQAPSRNIISHDSVIAPTSKERILNKFTTFVNETMNSDKKKKISKEQSNKLYNRLLEHQKRKQQAIQQVKALQDHQEQQRQEQLKTMHKSKASKVEVQRCVSRLVTDYEKRQSKLVEAKKQQVETFENELKTYFKPQLIAKDPRQSSQESRNSSVFEKLYSKAENQYNQIFEARRAFKEKYLNFYLSNNKN